MCSVETELAAILFQRVSFMQQLRDLSAPQNIHFTTSRPNCLLSTLLHVPKEAGKYGVHATSGCVRLLLTFVCSLFRPRMLPNPSRNQFTPVLPHRVDPGFVQDGAGLLGHLR